MTHMRRITVSKANIEEKQADPAGLIFLQIWLFVFTWILAGAFGSKGSGSQS